MTRKILEKPQQNGVIKRINMMLNERGRRMRIHARLPKAFWADAVSITTSLINRGLSVHLDYRLLEEVWSGKKLNLSFLKVFGCLSYIHIDFAARSKLNSKSKKYFLIGYGDTEFDYRFWDNQNQKIIRSRDVIFSKQVLYKNMLGKGSKNVDSKVKRLETVIFMRFPNE